jgi:regulator of RNase E activity RraA
MAFHVSVGDQLFLEEGGEEIGAVRKVAPDHLVVYVEAAGDFVVPGQWVRAAHDGKVVLDPAKVDEQLLAAAATAHESESDSAHRGRPE